MKIEDYILVYNNKIIFTEDYNITGLKIFKEAIGTVDNFQHIIFPHRYIVYNYRSPCNHHYIQIGFGGISIKFYPLPLNKIKLMKT